MKRVSYNYADKIELIRSGDEFFEKAKLLINRSKHKIHLQIYILADDSTGLEIIEALKEAAERKVEVCLLVDAFGSYELKSKTIKYIKKCGINFRKYSPVVSGYHLHFGRRLHHKILLCDGKEALLGGLNMDDNYHIKGKSSPWLDYAVYVSGGICGEIWRECERLWKPKIRLRIRKNKRFEGVHNNHPLVKVRLQQNDWLYGKKGISRSLNNNIRHARSSVIIMSSYFLPGGRMRRALKNASQRNVKVKIILPGLSDVKLVQYATKYWYAWMLRHNMELYEWHTTILHGKVMLVDKDWVSIGSYNINHLSHFSSIETNLEIKDAGFCRTVTNEMENVMANCKRITNSEYLEKMKVLKKFTCWSSFQLVRFLFVLQFAILSKE